MESSICTACTYSDFFLICKFSGLQVMPYISDHPRFIASVDTECF